MKTRITDDTRKKDLGEIIFREGQDPEFIGFNNPLLLRRLRDEFKNPVEVHKGKLEGLNEVSYVEEAQPGTEEHFITLSRSLHFLEWKDKGDFLIIGEVEK